MGDALLVLIGAVVGAVGSVAGSILVNRAELTRTARIRIFRDLVPPLLDQALDHKTENQNPALLHQLYREAVLAGGKEKDLALRAVGEWHEQASLLDVPAGIDPEGNVVRPAEGIARWNEANQRLIKTLLELEKHVERKIR